MVFACLIAHFFENTQLSMSPDATKVLGDCNPAADHSYETVLSMTDCLRSVRDNQSAVIDDVDCAESAT